MGNNTPEDCLKCLRQIINEWNKVDSKKCQKMCADTWITVCDDVTDILKSRLIN